MDCVDPARRARALAELRRRQAFGEAHGLTPSQRLERSEALRLAFAPHAAAGSTRGTDEPPELMLRLLRGPAT